MTGCFCEYDREELVSWLLTLMRPPEPIVEFRLNGQLHDLIGGGGDVFTK